MAETKINKFIGTNGTVVTPAASGGASGDAFNLANPPTPTGFTYSNDLVNPITGGTVGKVSVGAGVVAENRWTLADTTSVADQWVVRFTAPPTTSIDDVMQIRGTVQNMAARLSLTDLHQILNLGTAVSTPGSPNWTIVYNVWYVIDRNIVEGTATTGQIRYRVRTFADLSTTVFTYDTGATKNAGVVGTDVINSYRIGKITSAAVQPAFYFAQVGVSTDTGLAYMVDPGANVAPTSIVDADVLANVEPGQTVTLTITDSDVDGTIVTRNLTQVAGPTVTLSGSGGSGSTRTFTAPYTLAGTTVQFQYQVVDDDGATSVADAVSIDILPATERIVTVGGPTPTEVPLIVSIV